MLVGLDTFMLISNYKVENSPLKKFDLTSCMPV